MAVKKSDNLMKRPPVVVVVGHIDHGKTTLLDYIRKANIAAREAGGITQSIGAYEVIHNDRKITFIDTPGHEAFSKMRQRGARVADLGILVVAAEEGVKPQTKEAIEHLKKENVPFVVAINKIDKPSADIERTKKDLANAGVLVEGYGGDVSWQGVSAKTGEGVDGLLDLILLAADLNETTYDPEAAASGIIIEAKVDSRRGIIASLVLKNGTLSVGQEIATPTARGKIKALENFLRKPVKSLEPCAPALVLGFESLPQVGETFEAAGELALSEKRELAEASPAEVEKFAPKEGNFFRMILKANDSGSLEALKDLILALPQKEEIEITDFSVGEINDNDLKLAESTDSLIVGFSVKMNKTAVNLAKTKNIKIITSEIIYELLKTIERHLTEFKQSTAENNFEVLALFGTPKGKKQVIGGKVVSGIIDSKAFEVWRGNSMIGAGRLINLQQNKVNVKKVEAGNEAGMMVESGAEIKVGDILKF